MGGTFDPIHNGHLVAASEVADRFELDEVVFVPTGQPWQKQGRHVTAAEDRYLMTVIATAANPRFSVSRVDIDRGGATYTKDTLRDLQAQNPDADLFFITGADALGSILSWQNWEDLFSMARFVGVSRPGFELDVKHIAEAMAELPADALTLVEIPALAISSTDCRKRAGRIAADLVPGARRSGAVRLQARPVPAGRAERGNRSVIDDRASEAVAMAEVAARAAAAKLGEDVVVIDVSEQLVITDCFVLASGSNDRQVNAIVDEVEEKMRLAGYKPARREGTREGRWVLLDYVDIVVHIQHRDERDFYALDRLWRDCPVIPVDLDGAAMRVRRLVMLRHGQTEFNAGSRMQGQLDTDLSELGRAQAVAAAEVLAKRQPLLIVSSDLRRASTPRSRWASAAGCEVDIDTRLRETHLGDWQGLTHTEVDAAAPGARLAWRDDARWAPHGGESRVDVAERSLPLVAELVDTPTRMGRRRSRPPGGARRTRWADRGADRGAAGHAGGQLADPRRHGQRQLGAVVRAFGGRRGLCRDQVAPRRVERLGPGRQRCPLSHDRTARPNLLVFADSLSYYGPTGGLPSDDARIWPNIVAAQLGWDLELIGRIGWTCRDVWWAATQDPRSWAALRTRGRWCSRPAAWIRCRRRCRRRCAN